LAARRADQAVEWLWSGIHETLIESLRAEPTTAKLVAALEKRVRAGEVLAPIGAGELVGAFLASQERR